MGWDDGIGDVPWRELFGADGDEVVAALRELAEEGANGDRVYDVLEDHDNDYWWAESCHQPTGFRPEAVHALPFLAGIAADPRGIGSTAALEIIESMVDGALDRDTLTDEEIDALVDALRAGVEAIRPLLEEAHRLGHAGLYPIPALLENIDDGTMMGGAYEPRWRGVARPFAYCPTGRLAVAGDLLITREVGGIAFRDPRDGTPVHTFRYTGPPGTHPYAGGMGESPVTPFVDADGPGVLTIDVRGRSPRLWRLDGDGWRDVFLIRRGLRLRPSAWRARQAAARDGECLIQYADGVVARFDARTGEPTAAPKLEPLPTSPVRYEADGRAYTVRAGDDRLHRFDAETGEPVGPPIPLPYLYGFCAYRVGDRPYLAATGFRHLHRFDALTGEPAGPPLPGHRRMLRDVTTAVVDGRPQLYSADGATVRRWDAETGVPWPA